MRGRAPELFSVKGFAYRVLPRGLAQFRDEWSRGEGPRGPFWWESQAASRRVVASWSNAPRGPGALLPVRSAEARACQPLRSGPLRHCPCIRSAAPSAGRGTRPPSAPRGQGRASPSAWSAPLCSATALATAPLPPLLGGAFSLSRHGPTGRAGSRFRQEGGPGVSRRAKTPGPPSRRKREWVAGLGKNRPRRGDRLGP